jgi:AcrR family transcriptional regulator
VDKVRKRIRVTGAERQKQTAEITLKLVARYGIHGATISRIAAGVGLSRAALYKFFPNREAMLTAALDLMVERVPKWIDQSSGSDVFEHIMDMGRRHGTPGVAEVDAFIHPWFQFAAASGSGNMTEEMRDRHLVFIRAFAELVEEGKRDGSIRADIDTGVLAWTLMMWGWAEDVARLVGLREVIDSGTSVEVFKRMLGDIEGPSRDSHKGCAEEEKAPSPLGQGSLPMKI